MSGENFSFERRLLRLARNDAFTGFMEGWRGLIELYRLFTNYLEMSAKISSDPVFEKAIDAINELVEEYNQLILIRTNDDDDDNEEEVGDAENNIENN